MVYDHAGITILYGDALAELATLESGSVQVAITSPPYFGLRSYVANGHPDKALEHGAEADPAAYIARLVAVFREVRRVLRGDGTLWVVIGDSYTGSSEGQTSRRVASLTSDKLSDAANEALGARVGVPAGLKPKDLLGIPWMLAFALRDDGWYLRSDIIWAKPNPMPESVSDRPTTAHEHVFLLSKAANYWYDGEAIKEAGSETSHGGTPIQSGPKYQSTRQDGGRLGVVAGVGRNRRSVWTIPTQAFAGAHFACFPERLVEPMVLAGSRPGDVVLDPFLGSGTTAAVAKRLGRRAVGIELSADYIRLATDRLRQDVLPMALAADGGGG